MDPQLTDAVGRPIRVGDTVGGTTYGRYQGTFVGKVTKIGTAKVRVDVTQGDGGHRPELGEEVLISAYRVFVLAPTEPTADEITQTRQENTRFRAEIDRLTDKLAKMTRHRDYLRERIDCLTLEVRGRKEYGTRLRAERDQLRADAAAAKRNQSETTPTTRA
jgi:hypothetical protein